jgi:hypothetical protein
MDTRHSIANIFNLLCEVAQIIEIFDHSLFSPKERSIAERYRRKHAAKLSVVFVTAHRIVFSVYGEKVE